MEPSLIFSLTVPDSVYPLPNVAETRLCRVNLGLGGVGVPGILDTGAQRSLLSATVTSACACEPTTINAVLYWGQTNGGSLWRLADCHRRAEKMPSVEAELDTVDAILGMDFLKVYDVTITSMTSLA